MRRDRNVHLWNVRMMPFPTLDATFWEGVTHYQHPRAVCIYLRAMKWLRHTVSGSLTDTEMMLMSWIIEYTVGDQLPSRPATFQEISNGNGFVRGRRMSARLIQKTVTGLADGGLLVRRV